MKAVLLVSHGSRSSRTRQEIARLVRSIGKMMPGVMVKYAFLEIQRPSIPAGIDRCVAAGAGEVTIALNFLNSGRHASDDIPAIVKTAQKKYPRIKFAVTKPVGQHRGIANLFLDLITHA